jgi:phospholipid/cholesterol/gamma-HCH transport system ATP-binding protein
MCGATFTGIFARFFQAAVRWFKVELRLESVSVRFGALAALSNVSAVFSPGTRTCITGRAGSGKTTVLKLLAGLLKPTVGHVKWGNTDAERLDTDARRAAQAAFGMVFQTDALFDSMSVMDNVMLPLRKRGVPEVDATVRALEALKRVGLSGADTKRPEHLSGGMKKRAGIARAIVARPEVLFADDPFAGLDPDMQESIAALLLEVSEGRTLITALADPFEPMPLGDVLHLDKGALAR